MSCITYSGSRCRSPGRGWPPPPRTTLCLPRAGARASPSPGGTPAAPPWPPAGLKPSHCQCVLNWDLFQWRRHWPRLPQLPVSRLHVLAAVALLREGGNKSPNIFCTHINNQHLRAQVSPTHLVLTLLPASLADLKQLTLSEDTVARYSMQKNIFW